MIYYADSAFNELKSNPFNNGKPYDNTWMVLRLIDDAPFFQYTGTGDGYVFQFILTKKNIDWQYRIMDCINYEIELGKNLIVAVNSADLDEAKAIYKGHSNNDNYLRHYERSVLVHSTTPEGYKNILKSGRLKSWNILKNEGATNEQKPIGSFLNDPEDYSDYIMFNNGGFSVELVISSKQKGFICMDKNAEYTAGARLYLDAAKVAGDGLLVRDGAHLKVKGTLQHDKYLIWTATPEVLGINAETTPFIFGKTADETFERLFKVAL